MNNQETLSRQTPLGRLVPIATHFPTEIFPAAPNGMPVKRQIATDNSVFVGFGFFPNTHCSDGQIISYQEGGIVQALDCMTDEEASPDVDRGIIALLPVLLSQISKALGCTDACPYKIIKILPTETDLFGYPFELRLQFSRKSSGKTGEDLCMPLITLIGNANLLYDQERLLDIAASVTADITEE